MKLRKGQESVKLPPIGEMLHVVVDEREKGGHCFVVRHVNPKDFQALLKKQRKQTGRPSLYTLLGDRLYFHPKADGRYEMRIRFMPPAVEL